MIPTTKKPPKVGFCLLLAEDFDLCAQIWDHSKEPDRVIEFKTGIESGNRITYLYYLDNKPVGEVSLVHHMPDPDHTIPGKRVYFSHLTVAEDYHRQGIATKLTVYAAEQAAKLGYSEMCLEVDLDNYPALKLYDKQGFHTIICVDEDQWGKYMKLLKYL